MCVVETAPDQEITILQHRVNYYFRDHPSKVMGESSEEHVRHMIAEGYNQGELCEMGDDQETEYRGWWSINN
jgi:hypothetical protein